MGFEIADLWRAPKINPVNNKAKSIPVLNPFNIYGRVFLLSWWSFFIAFWSWYAFPPLLTVTIKQDLDLTQNQIANSNVLALVATFIVRLSAGAACDRFGPRWTFVALLIVGAIPTALAGAVSGAAGLLVLRFFIGILGGTFVPCQVWTTGFFDKNVVGTANALAAGLGNAGSGVTYFLMPSIFDSLVKHRHLSAHVAWRVTFIVPFIIIITTAIAIVLTCPDAPTGKWSSRAFDMQRQTEARDMYVSQFDQINSSGSDAGLSHTGGGSKDGRSLHKYTNSDPKPVELVPAHRGNHGVGNISDPEDDSGNVDDFLNAASWELVDKPTYHGTIKALISLPTLTLVVSYFCTFGTELSINSFLGAYYLEEFPKLGQTGSGRWAAMYGLLNAVFRPLGGIISDVIYRITGSLWAKKILVHILAVIMGVFMILIGLLNSKHLGTMVGLMTGLAFFEEAGNGSLFSLLPHVHPTSNGMLIFPCQQKLFLSFAGLLSPREIFPSFRFANAGFLLQRSRHRGHRRCGESRRYRLPAHLALRRHQLRQGLLDCGHYKYWVNVVCGVDQAHSKGSSSHKVIEWSV